MPVIFKHVLIILATSLSAAVLAEEPRPLVIEAGRSWVSAIAFSPDGERIAVGNDDETLTIWDAQTGKNLLKVPQTKAAISAIAFRADGKQLLTGDWDGRLSLWDAANGQKRKTIAAHRENITSLALDPKGKRLATGSGDDTLKIWNAQTLELLLDLPQSDEYDVTSVAFSPDGKAIVSGDGENTLTLRDAATGKTQRVLRGHRGAIACVAFSPDGKRIISGSWDDTLKTVGCPNRAGSAHAERPYRRCDLRGFQSRWQMDRLR